ncbi:hypothetical protein Bca4012_037049 [Brassica carinata]|uniref:Uncharacterized protein n=1 Tax=Brassica carinata TaxID=52824 RepID=A0A8X7WF02_BRACI|nr:hypothetical protein Bca52824_010738 [Brassica carinata]
MGAGYLDRSTNLLRTSREPQRPPRLAAPTRSRTQLQDVFTFENASGVVLSLQEVALVFVSSTAAASSRVNCPL